MRKLRIATAHHAHSPNHRTNHHHQSRNNLKHGYNKPRRHQPTNKHSPTNLGRRNPTQTNFRMGGDTMLVQTPNPRKIPIPPKPIRRLHKPTKNTTQPTSQIYKTTEGDSPKMTTSQYRKDLAEAAGWVAFAQQQFADKQSGHYDSLTELHNRLISYAETVHTKMTPSHSA